MSSENVAHADKQFVWWRRSAPAPIGRPLAAAYGLLLLGLSMSAGQTAGTRFQSEMLPMRLRLILGGLVGLVVLLTGSVRPVYLSPLVFVVLLILVLDPATRVMWRHRQTHR